MPAPLLTTKLFVPAPRPGLVPRQRLLERLDRGTAARLTLVSAPAGFGKTTLLADWLAARHQPAAWVSLDAGDSEPGSFWGYVVAALRTVVPTIGECEPGTSAEAMLTTLPNDLAAAETEVVLVLDDYHLVDSPAVHEAMALLLDRLPAHVHVVLACRADPAMPLARLRSRGELVELRAAELRFTPDEAASYLTGVMGLPLTTYDVTALEERTEGWIAALQLAALSLQGRDDHAGFIAGFTGDDRYIVDYLAEEVLQRQPVPVRDFLLRTSVLTRLSGPLCDAVTGQGGGRAMLETLDRANLFVVPLDDRREWFRYHHLFADVLRARLADEAPHLVAGLHLRASEWWAGHGDLPAAIEHAMTGGHLSRAADLVELAIPTLRRNRQEATFRRWLEALPEEVVEVRPVLGNSFAGSLLSTGQVAGVARRLDVAERWLDPGPELLARRVVVDEEEFRRLPAAIAVHRAGLALATGDLAATVGHARRALDLLGADDHLGRGAATALLGLASWAGGDLVTAHEAYVGCLGSMLSAGHLADILACSIALADLQLTLGRLRDARLTYEHALALNPATGAPLRGTADMYVGLSALHLERDDLAAARELLARADALGEHLGLPQNAYRSLVALARLREAEGSPREAEDLLDAAELAYVGDFSPDVRPVAATRARVWVRQVRTGEAFEWARRQGVAADDDLGYLREYEHVTLARALLARSSAEHAKRNLDDATGLLGRLLRAAETGGRTGSVIEILALQALALRARGDLAGAVRSLGRALRLAEPEGYVRVFVDEGPVMVGLLEAAAREGVVPDYVRRLLADPVRPTTPPRGVGLVDPLSRRELDVLRLLATELAGPAIARELVVSLNTVRTHTQGIYGKLGVSSRRAAVRRAGELDLLPPLTT